MTIATDTPELDAQAIKALKPTKSASGWVLVNDRDWLARKEIRLMVDRVAVHHTDSGHLAGSKDLRVLTAEESGEWRHCSICERALARKADEAQTAPAKPARRQAAKAGE